MHVVPWRPIARYRNAPCWAIALASALLAPACLQRQAFECSANEDCNLNGEIGQCESVGFCSYPDSVCESGQRYQSDAPDELGGTCVPASSSTSPTLMLVRKRIGAGGDFLTISDWESARNGNLVTRQIYEVSDPTGTFKPSELVRGSGCSGSYVPEGTQASGAVLSLDSPQGQCETGTLLVGDESGATATTTEYVGDGVIEEGLLTGGIYDESVVLDGWSTDPEHYVHLTVDASARHRGVAGTGATLDPDVANNALTVLVDHSRISWLEITDWSTGGSHTGIFINADGVSIDNVLLHDDGSEIITSPDSDGISLNSDGSVATIRNSIIYGVGRSAVASRSTTDSVVNLDCVSIYQCNEAGHAQLGCVEVGDMSVNTTVNVRNTIAFSASGVRAFRIGGGGDWGISSNNLSGDNSAPGNFSIDLAVANEVFLDVAADSVDLHLSAGSDAISAGINLSDEFSIDIDDEERPSSGAWDIGADQR